MRAETSEAERPKKFSIILRISLSEFCTAKFGQGETAKSLPESKAVLWKDGGWILDARKNSSSQFPASSIQFVPHDPESNRGAR